MLAKAVSTGNTSSLLTQANNLWKAINAKSPDVVTGPRLANQMSTTVELHAASPHLVMITHSLHAYASAQDKLHKNHVQTRFAQRNNDLLADRTKKLFSDMLATLSARV